MIRRATVYHVILNSQSDGRQQKFPAWEEQSYWRCERVKCFDRKTCTANKINLEENVLVCGDKIKPHWPWPEKETIFRVREVLRGFKTEDSFREDDESQKNVTCKEGFDLIATLQANATISDNHHKRHQRTTFWRNCKDSLKPENVDQFVFIAEVGKVLLFCPSLYKYWYL